MDEGYIKYQSNWEKRPVDVAEHYVDEILQWREIIYRQKWIGLNKERIGYGNISRRIRTVEFLITGSATGGVQNIGAEQLAVVTDIYPEQNSLSCYGLTEASSEAMSHGAIYAALPEVSHIVHIHDAALWNKWKGKLPTTSSTIAYGTPAMAEELARLVTGLKSLKQVIVMGGHKEGIIAYGSNFREVYDSLLKLKNESSISNL